MYARSPLVQVQRTLAAQAAAKRTAEAPAIQTKKLDNGLTVIGMENGGKLSSAGVLTKAGSRYETYDNLGISHTLRAAFGLSSHKFTGFGITRNIQQAGSNVSASGSRDCIMYASSFIRDKKHDHVMDYMFDAISNAKFKRWEVPAAHEKVQIQVAEMSPEARATELLHKAAYRDGLGYSVFCPEHMIGKHSTAQLEAFHQKHVTGDRTVLVGVNVDFNKLTDYAGSLELEKGAGPGSSAKYYGGEERFDIIGNIAHVAIAADAGNPVANLKEAAAMYLLKLILGGGAHVKYGQLSGKLPKALKADGIHAVTGIHCGYPDSSLVGAFISTDAASAGENVSKVAQALRSITVSEQEFQAAKKMAGVINSEMALNPIGSIEMLGSHALFTSIDGFEAEAELLSSVTLADVQAAAKKISNAKLSMGAVGNLANIPYVESL